MKQAQLEKLLNLAFLPIVTMSNPKAVLFIIKWNFCIEHGNLVFHNQGKIITFHYGCSLMNENEMYYPGF